MSTFLSCIDYLTACVYTKGIKRFEGGTYMEKNVSKEVKRIIICCIASCIIAVNIRTFVRTGGLFPGGANGLTLLIQSIFDRYLHITIPYTAINVLLNAIPVYIGFRFIGKKFTLCSCLVIFLTGFLTDSLPAYTITSDILLISIFGGLINGFAISLCLKCDATTGGTDFISIFLSRRKGIDAFNIILGFNVVILAIAGLLFGWDKALYSMIFQYTSTQVLHLLYKQYQKQTLFIVTNKAEAISQLIYDTTVHGATIIDCEGAISTASIRLSTLLCPAMRIIQSSARFARQIRRHLLTVCLPMNWKAISISGRLTSTSSFLFILALTFLEVKCLYGYMIHI